MKVFIKNSSEIEELKIIDYPTEIDWTIDLLGNSGVHTDEEGHVHLSREEFDWWSRYIEGHEATERDIADLAEDAGVEYAEIQAQVFEYMGQQDMEDERARAVQKIEELREAYWGKVEE